MSCATLAFGEQKNVNVPSDSTKITTTVYIFLANSKNPLSPIFYFLFLSFGEIQKDPQLLEITFSNTSAFSPHPFYHE